MVAILTPRLRLRELEDSDFDSVHAYATDPLVVRFMPWGPNSEDDTTGFIRRSKSMAAATPRTGYELAVVLRDTSELIGAIGLHLTESNATDAMLGYCFARGSWGRGYATEAARALLHYGFTSLGLETIWAGCDVGNHASIAVLGKLGMTLDSVADQLQDSDHGAGNRSLMFRVCLSDFENSDSTVA